MADTRVKITLLYCGNEFQMEACSFALNLMKMLQERVELLVAPFLGLLNILVLDHKV